MNLFPISQTLGCGPEGAIVLFANKLQGGLAAWGLPLFLTPVFLSFQTGGRR